MSNEEWLTTEDPCRLIEILIEHGHAIRELAVDIIRRNGGPPTYTEEDQLFDFMYCHGHPYLPRDVYNHDHWDNGLVRADCPDPLVSFKLLYAQLYLGRDVVRGDCDYIREAVNPYAPPVRAEWRTDTVRLLAACVLERGDFSAMPILADALQDAGCDSNEMLDHCRHERGHGERCWVLRGLLEEDSNRSPDHGPVKPGEE
jgi:hypothetical protein